MRYLFLFAIIIFVSLNSYAQRKLKIGINFSPDYCYRILKVDSTNNHTKSLMNYRNETEIPKISFSTSINLLYQFSNNFELETGLQYSNNGYRTKKSKVNGFDYYFKYSFHQLNLPVRIIYKTNWEKKMQFTSSVGIATSYLFKYQTITFLSENNEKFERKAYDYTKIYNYKEINFMPTVSIGIDYVINNKFNLKLEPTFRYGLVKIIKTPITERLWNVGLNMGFYYTLKQD